MKDIITQQYNIVKQLIYSKHGYTINTLDNILYLYDMIDNNVRESSECHTLFVINYLNDMDRLDRSSIVSVFKRLYGSLYNHYKGIDLNLLYNLNSVYSLYFDDKIEVLPIYSQIKKVKTVKNECTFRKCTKISKGIYCVYRIINDCEYIYYTASIRIDGKNLQKMNTDLDVVKNWYNEKIKDKPIKTVKVIKPKSVKKIKPIITIKNKTIDPDKYIKIVNRVKNGITYNYFQARLTVNHKVYQKTSNDRDVLVDWIRLKASNLTRIESNI